VGGAGLLTFDGGKIFALETGGDDGNFDFVAHGFVEHDAEVNLNIFVLRGFADERAGFVARSAAITAAFSPVAAAVPIMA
jgi:hypothetical protein